MDLRFGLSEAITREILAAFEIDVLELRDAYPVLGLSEDALRGRRPALLQTALLEQAARHHLKTVMTFRQRVERIDATGRRVHRAFLVRDCTTGRHCKAVGEENLTLAGGLQTFVTQYTSNWG
ncbi:hypothetical protein ACWD3L_35035, partial [Streptomyces sp. NPDC002587]